MQSGGSFADDYPSERQKISRNIFQILVSLRRASSEDSKARAWVPVSSFSLASMKEGQACSEHLLPMTCMTFYVPRGLNEFPPPFFLFFWGGGGDAARVKAGNGRTVR